MDQPLIQQQPLLAAYNLASDHDYQIVPQHGTYAAGGVADNLRRDGSLANSTDIMSTSNNICAPQRASAHDSEYRGLSDSGPGSISTSPGSNASSIAFSANSTASLYNPTNTAITLAGSSYPAASQVFTGSHYAFSHPYNSLTLARPRLSSIGDTTSGILSLARPSGFGNPISPSSTATIREQYATSTPGLSRHLGPPRSPFDTVNRTYNGYSPETPRIMMASASMSLSPTYSTTGGMAYRDTDTGADSLPFLEQETVNEIICVGTGQAISPTIDAKTEKGFFKSVDEHWTCYRRNYFAVQCSYQLSPYPAGHQLRLVETGQRTQQDIQALGVCLSAAVDNSGGKSIDLVQHTPKRDRGPQKPVRITKLVPMPPGPKHISPLTGYPPNTFEHATAHQQPSPSLPLQNEPDPEEHHDVTAGAGGFASPSPSAHQYTFERIQFKSATANNGKRRAQQQFYHLIVELWADVRKLDAKEPDWKKVAQRVSQPVVVRGRSPSHYSNEGPHSALSRGPPAGSSGTGSGLGGAGFTRYGSSIGYASTYRGHGPTSSIYSMHSTPLGTSSISSASSNDTVPVDAFGGHAKPMILHSSADDHDGKGYETNGTYQYIPAPLYDPTSNHNAKAQVYEPLRVKHEEQHGSVFPHGGVAQAFRGIDSSRGIYSTVSAGY